MHVSRLLKEGKLDDKILIWTKMYSISNIGC